ncbi:hypothetical protein ABMA28_005045, partial [Loxostege sticticalis]
GPVQIDEEAEWLRQAMSNICDASMPRAKPMPPKQQVYWWSDALAELRAACIAARRQSSRHLRRRRRDPELDGPLWEAYRVAKKAFQIAIAEAKAKAREDLLATLSEDPWGRPYRTVRGKLRPWAPPSHGVLGATAPDECCLRPLSISGGAHSPSNAAPSHRLSRGPGTSHRRGVWCGGS